ncbi:MAG: carbon starvation protein A [Nitrospirae bacterium]|nr:carbon starvation protein A [Nitrospirota bacterium]
MIYPIVLISILILTAAYKFYGGYLSRQLDLDDSRPTPACSINDGIDFVPAKPALLLGQHFSAIAAAGPIVGPVLAGIWFGWLPALLWIIIGSIFIGGVHDFASITASVRHGAASIGEIVKEHMSRTSYVLFLIFIWLALIYVIIAFTDITAQTFRTVTAGTAYGPGVAASSILYLLLGVMMGVLLYKFRVGLWLATAVFLPLVFGIIWIGPRLPQTFIAFLSDITVRQWDLLLLTYCLAASLMPVWLLLQPRGYLGGWLLYMTIIIGLAGALFGGFTIEYPALNVDGFKSLANGKLIFPVLFITVACGACSGFHGIVSSGTTSKQLMKETDAKIVGYGGMLLEGLVGVLALTTLMMLPKGSPGLSADPNLIYANGLASYLGLAGVGFSVAYPFALLAFSTFVYDTLDVTTRLARYIFQELTGWRTRAGGFFAAAVTLLVPLIFLTLTKEKGYLTAWPIFGTSNQLLASLVLLSVAVWLIKSGRSALYAVAPMIFMMTMTLWSLWLLVLPLVKLSVTPAQILHLDSDALISGVFGVILLFLSVLLIFEAVRILVLKPVESPLKES